MNPLSAILALNVVLGVFVYRDLLRFRPNMVSGVSVALDTRAEQALFTATETAPLLVALLAFWLLHRRRRELFALPVTGGGPLWLAFSLAGLGVAIFAWAVHTRSTDLQAFSLIANLMACAVLWRGPSVLRVAWLPLFLLLFAVPIPAPMMGQLLWTFQSWTAVLAGWLLSLLGVTALVSGDIIRLPQETFQVIEGCSGLRSVVTTTMLTIIMVDLFGRRGLHAAILLIAAPIVALLMNGLRVLTLILNPHSEIHSIHTAQGIAVLLAGLTALYLIDGGLERWLPRAPEPAPATPQPPESSFAVGLPPMARCGIVTAVLAAMLAVSFWMPVWKYSASRGRGVFLASYFTELGAWRTEGGSQPEDRTSGVAFRDTLLRRYALSNEPGDRARAVEVFIGTGEHLERYRAPYSPKTAFPGRGWMTEARGRRVLAGSGREVRWRLLRSGTRRVVAYHWYEEQRGTLGESMRSLLALDRSRFARALPVVTVRMATAVHESSERQIELAHERLEAVYAELRPQLEVFKLHLGQETPHSQ